MESKATVSSSKRMESERGRISVRHCSGSVDKQESINHVKGNDVTSVYMTLNSTFYALLF